MWRCDWLISSVVRVLNKYITRTPANYLPTKLSFPNRENSLHSNWGLIQIILYFCLIICYCIEIFTLWKYLFAWQVFPGDTLLYQFTVHWINSSFKIRDTPVSVQSFYSLSRLTDRCLTKLFLTVTNIHIFNLILKKNCSKKKNIYKKNPRKCIRKNKHLK